MNRKQFVAFLESLEPMKGHADKAVNRNYRKILDAGFRCDRKGGFYVHPRGWKICWAFDKGRSGIFRWIEIKRY